SADETRTARAPNPRLLSPRDHLTLCRPGISPPAKSSANATASTAIRNFCAFWLRSTTRSLLIWRSIWSWITTALIRCQRCIGGCSAAPLSSAFYPNKRLLAQSSRTLVCQDHPAAHSPRNLYRRQALGSGHPRLHPDQ